MRKLFDATIKSFPGLFETGRWIDAAKKEYSIRDDMDENYIKNVIKMLERGDGIGYSLDEVDQRQKYGVASDDEIDLCILYKKKIAEFETFLNNGWYKK